MDVLSPETEEEEEEEEATTYRIYGSTNSPYSVKVRAYFRFKNIRHEWIPRDFDTQAEFQELARIPIVPLVLGPDGAVMQDSTPIIESVEEEHPMPSVHPEDPALKFLSELIEEFSDEWANKWMFHFRWARPVDQEAVSQRLAGEMLGAEAEADDIQEFARTLRARMITRGFAVGSNPTTGPFLERNYALAIRQLDAHLQARPFLFGSKPCLADFGLAAQLYQALIDPTAGNMMRDTAPTVAVWCQHVVSGANDGYRVANAPASFEPWTSLAQTLEPFLRSHVRTFLAWSRANASAVQSKAKEMSVLLDEHQSCGTTSVFRWTCSVSGPQRYHAKSLRVLLAKFEHAQPNEALRSIMKATGCLEFLDEPAQSRL